MAISQDPNDPNFGLETDDTSPNFGLPAEQPKEEGGVVSGVLAGLGRALNPVNLIKGALDIGGESDISKIRRYGTALGEIVTGTPARQALEQNIPEVAQQQAAVFGEQGGREQAAALTGIGLQAGLLVAPFVHGRLREVAFGEKPAPAIPEVPVEPLAAEARAVTTPEEVTVNASEITSPESVIEPEVRAPVGEGAPLRQQGETPEARQVEVVPEEVIPPEAEPQPPAATAPEEPAPVPEAEAPTTAAPTISNKPIPGEENTPALKNSETGEIATGATHANAAADLVARDPSLDSSKWQSGFIDQDGKFSASAGGMSEVSARKSFAEAQKTAAPEAAPPEVPPTPAESQAAARGETVGIAERYREEQQPGSVIPGVGRTSEEARTWGHDFINKGGNPYDIVNNKGPKRELWQDVGGVRAEYERLSNTKRAAEDALDKDPNNQVLQDQFNAADEAQRKWSKDMQPVLTRAGDALRAATRTYPREISTFSDFTDIANDHFKGDVQWTPEKRAELQKAVKVIQKTKGEVTNARVQEIDSAVKKAGGKVMSFEDLRNDLKAEITKKLEDCVI